MVLHDTELGPQTEDKNTGDLSYSGSLKHVFCPPPTSFEYFTERYYHPYLFENCKKIDGNNVRVLLHSNGLCILCVDPSHTAVKAIQDSPPGEKLSISSVVFGSSRGNSNISTGFVGVVGKKKKNALVCQTETRLCTLVLSDGSSYPIPACLNGFVLELNGYLQKEPWMVGAAPTAEGFIAVINPSPKNDFASMKKIWTATGGELPVEAED